jgi:hypothetical protein
MLERSPLIAVGKPASCYRRRAGLSVEAEWQPAVIRWIVRLCSSPRCRRDGMDPMGTRSHPRMGRVSTSSLFLRRRAN